MKGVFEKDKVISAFLMVVSVVLLLAAVLPMLAIAKYAHPCADDYTYGYLAHEAWNTTHSFFSVIKCAFEQVKDSYYSWQGTYTSIFLMAISPAVFEGSISYGVSTYIMLGMLIVSVTYIIYVLFFKVFHGKKWQAFFVAFVTIFWMIESVNSPVNAFFWFNGSVHYSFMHGCMLLMAGNFISYVLEKKGRNRKTVKCLLLFLASLFAFICGGSNYSTALVGICICGLLLVWDIAFHGNLYGFIPLGTYLVSFLINILAPGNQVRGNEFEGMGVAEAIINSFRFAFSDVIRWFDFQTVIILLLLIPVLYSVSKQFDLKRKILIPLLSVAVSFGLHAAMHVPLLYAAGGSGLARQGNICKFWFQLMVVINTFLIICALRPLLPEKKCTLVLTVVFYFCMAAIMAVHMKTSKNAICQYSSYVAYVELKSGVAEEYYSTYKDRLIILGYDKGDVVLPPYNKSSYLLYFDDVSVNSDYWTNTAFARWYGVNSVRKLK